VYTVSQYASPALLDGLLNWIERNRSRPQSSLFVGFQYVLGFVAIRIIASLIIATTYYQLARQIGRVRVTLMGSVYRKSLRLAPEERGKRTIGDIVSHITVDAEAMNGGVWFFPMVISFIPSISLGVYLLQKQLSWIAYVGLGWIIVVLSLTQGFNSSAMADEFAKRMSQVDKRTLLVNEVIENIKHVKFSAWETPLIQRIMAIRQQELKHLRRMSILLGRIVFPSHLVREGALIIMFSLYTFRVGIPNPSTIFVTMTIFNIMYLPIEQFGLALGWVMALWKAFNRIADFLAANELDEANVTINEELARSGTAVIITDAKFAWKKGADGPADDDALDEQQFTLEIPSLNICQSELLVVVGRVGAGKSSLVQGIIGQMHLLQGSVEVASNQVAYCSQTPFILAASVRDNILGFDRPLNETLLETVVEACALGPDIEMLPGGLNCEIGERGVNLSGGQKYVTSLSIAVSSTLIHIQITSRASKSLLFCTKWSS
jgi:ATP-binding cassette, subfamily C (CFTR/MRP), member 1